MPSITTEFMRRRAQHLGFLHVLCRDPALAEDLFQDLAVAVIEGAGNYRPELGDFDAWVRGIARNLWRAHLRRRRPATPLDALAEEAVEAAWDDRGPAETLAQEERLGRLRGCLERLSPSARDLVLSRYERRETSAAIADRLGRTATAIDTALYRLRGVLGDCLGGTP